MSIQCINIKISKSKEQNKRILLRIKNITQFMSQLHAYDKKKFVLQTIVAMNVNKEEETVLR